MYEVLDSRTAYRGVMTAVRVDRVAMPDGDSAEREVVLTADAVAVVAVDEQDRVVLVRQYRHPLGAYLLELPAGKLDVEGEPPTDAVLRELREEAGLAAGSLRFLGRCHNSAGWTTEATSLYLAQDLSPAAPEKGYAARHEEADLRVERVALHEAVRRARHGEITDAKTVIGLLLAAPLLGADPPARGDGGGGTGAGEPGGRADGDV